MNYIRSIVKSGGFFIKAISSCSDRLKPRAGVESVSSALAMACSSRLCAPVRLFALSVVNYAFKGNRRKFGLFTLAFCGGSVRRWYVVQP